MHPFSKPPSSCWGSAEVGFYRARSRTSISRLGKTSQPHTYNPLTVLVNSFSSSLRGKPENQKIHSNAGLWDPSFGLWSCCWSAGPGSEWRSGSGRHRDWGSGMVSAFSPLRENNCRFWWLLSNHLQSILSKSVVLKCLNVIYKKCKNILKHESDSYLLRWIIKS